jgi:hypothetical protein
MAQKGFFSARNREASLLRRRKYQLVRRFGLPESALGGHLAMTYRRCGKPTCHCATGPGHPRWALTYSFEGHKRVELVPQSLARELLPLVEQGRELREAVMEVLAINLQLLRLWRENERGKRPKSAGRRGGTARCKRKSTR